MSLPTYSTGLASVEAGDTIVTGTGVLWSGINVKQGDFISINGEPPALIIEVIDDEHIRIQPYGGPIPPTITSAAAISVNENAPLAHTLTADEAVTWSKLPGDDASLVEIFSGNVLRWTGNTTRNFEAPADADGNNIYLVTVRATDADLNIADQSISITVLDVSDAAPVITSSSAVSVNEGVPLVHLLTASEAVTWSKVSGVDFGTVEIVSGNILRWTGNVSRDFEAPADADGNNVYQVTIRATDVDLNTADQSLSITVLNVDEVAPVITSSAAVSVNEGVALAHVLTASEAVTWAVVGGADAGTVQIVSGNVLRWTGGVFRDFEIPADADGNNQYVAQVRARDAALNETFQTITITVLDVDETGPPVTTGTPIGLLLALTTTATSTGPGPGTSGTPIGLLLVLTGTAGALRRAGSRRFATSRSIADAVNAPYIIYQNYVGRVVGVAVSEDVGEMLARLRDQSPIYNVPASATVPDPAYGTDGQWAYQISTDSWWIRDAGAWNERAGPPLSGGGVATPPADSLVYGRKNVGGTTTWQRAVAGGGDTMTGALTLFGPPTAAAHVATKAYVDATVVAPTSPPPDAGMIYNGLQINGGMEISQAMEAAVTPFAAGSVNKYVVDGWRIAKVGSHAFNAQQTASVFPGYAKQIKLTVTTAQASLGGGDYIILRQPIEGYRSSCLAWGTAAAIPLTVGFWVKSSVAGPIIVQAHNNVLGASNTVTIIAANVSQFITTTFAAQTTGTWATGNSAGVVFDMYIAHASASNIAATVGNTFEITGVVVLPGSEAPTAALAPLLMRPYDQELLTCMRYCEALPASVANEPIANGFVNSSFSVHIFHEYKVVKRAVPILTSNLLGGAGPHYQIRARNTYVGATGSSAFGTGTGSSREQWSLVSSLSGIANNGEAAQLLTTGASAHRSFWDARL